MRQHCGQLCNIPVGSAESTLKKISEDPDAAMKNPDVEKKDLGKAWTIVKARRRRGRNAHSICTADSTLK
jgi:hypothetical protein